MSARLIVTAVATAALTIPAAAGAKQITSVRVCGAHACTTLTSSAATKAFMDAGSFAEEAPRAAQRSFTVRARIDEPGDSQAHYWTSRWLPDAGLIASRDDSDGSMLFTGVDPQLTRILRRATRGFAAFPARRFERVAPTARVDEVVPAPASHPATASSSGGGWPAIAWAAIAALLVVLAGAGAMRMRRGRPTAPSS
jgi:hypothetical protein